MRASSHLLEPPEKRPATITGSAGAPVGDILSRASRNLSSYFGLARERERGVHLSRYQMHGKRADPAMTERNEQQPTAPYPAEKARGGEIILRTPLRRAIFIAGLVGAVVLALLLAFAGFAH